MTLNDVLIDLFGRVTYHVEETVPGLDVDDLTRTAVAGTNPIGWLVWHLTRVQDHHMAEILDEPQIWVSGRWAARFGLADDPDNTGYGHSADQVAEVRPESAEALLAYHRAVAERTTGFLERLDVGELGRIVDRRWDPPVTLGVRLVSIADDDIQHAGQAAYLRGLLGLG
jgi:uncharacterized damage-inducible protein DinB